MFLEFPKKVLLQTFFKLEVGHWSGPAETPGVPGSGERRPAALRVGGPRGERPSESRQCV